MIVAKHISIDKEYIKELQPFVDRHNGNFSSAIREIIELANRCYIPENSSMIDEILFKWMLEEIDGIILPNDILDKMIDPSLISPIDKLRYYLIFRFSQLEWKIEIVLKSDNDSNPSEIFLETKGSNEEIRFVAYLISHYLIKNSMDNKNVKNIIPIKIKSVHTSNYYIKVEYSRSDRKESTDSLINNFGDIDYIIKEVEKYPKFWKSIIHRYIRSNYNMVAIHRNYFEDIGKGDLLLGAITIENLAKKPIQDIHLRDMLRLIKIVYETSRVVDRVEIDNIDNIENNRIILYHNYRSKDAVERLKRIIVSLLEANGHLYDAKATANIIVLTHRPHIGIKINEIVSNLLREKEKIEKGEKTNTGIDQELIMFVTFLKGLEDIPDIPISLSSLGRRIGMSLIKEYEKDKKIEGKELKEWNLENFVKAFQIIDKKLHRESEWKLEGNSLLYTVKECEIAKDVESSEGRCICESVCYTIREAFKGALYQAFEDRAEIDVRKLITHGDSYCEVLITCNK